ncbi:MAG: PBP1A family penicillin-binding protein [Proteobacteria bacterium]|nr:PBP1A family penicillin-binding protein [Pseudomonadota bacterium]
MFRKIFRFFIFLGLLLCLISIIGAGLVGTYFYIRFTKDLPQIDSLKDYNPKAVTSIYSEDGVLIAEAFDEPCRRYPVSIDEIPPLVRNAFLAAEDANFYKHQGIDPISILRALYKNIVKQKAKQGASTITQQTVKSLLLTREKSMERKVKEAILSYRLEKYLTKDEIFSIYLNEIYLGSAACGVKAAAKVHFHKDLNQLTIAESAFLAGLPQRPSQLSNPRYRSEALKREHYVLGQMLRNNFISLEEHENALKEELVIHKQDDQTIFAAPYYAGHLIKNVLPEIFTGIDPYITAGNPGGYSVKTSVSVKATEIAVKALQKGAREVDKRRGWRGVLDKEKANLQENKNILSNSDIVENHVYKALVHKIGSDSSNLIVQIGGIEAEVNLKKAEWAKRFLKDDKAYGGEPAKAIRVGDIIEVSLDNTEKNKDEKQKRNSDKLIFKLDQTPELESAFFLSNSTNGEIKAMVGGYDYQRNQFNRVTQAMRQPGSSFKPFVYLSALETLGYTPSTIVPDTPISLVAGDGKLWTPGNFDGKFLGPITLRTALQRSRNVVSVYLIQKLGVERVIQTARKMGISTEIPPNLSIALGSAEVNMFELVRAYSCFSSGGLLFDPLFIKEIKDRNGKVIYQQLPHAKRVVSEDDAFIMANMMKGVVERGTATILKSLEKPIAGKTGTTNDQMDTWFIGYTPELAAGVWVGFNENKTIGKTETGGKAAAPIMLYFMKDYLTDTPAFDFIIPDGVVPIPVNLESGQVVPGSEAGAFIEYFKAGTEPKYQKPAENTETEENETEQAPDSSTNQEYLQNKDF